MPGARNSQGASVRWLAFQNEVAGVAGLALDVRGRRRPKAQASGRKLAGRRGNAPPGPIVFSRSLVDLQAGLFQPLQDCIKVFRLRHELLETLHAGLGHFGGRVTVEELRCISGCAVRQKPTRTSSASLQPQARPSRIGLWFPPLWSQYVKLRADYLQSDSD